LFAKNTWDDLNRMKSVQGTQDGSVNLYRADGLRARRVTGVSIGFDVDDQGAVSGYYDQFALDRPTWRYYHDGQAPFEDDVTYNPGSGTRKDVTRYALGARGGDMAETVLAMGSSGERTVRSYPLYDGHGNTVGQVARTEDGAPDASFAPVPGAPAFELGTRRKYDAWGQVRWSEGSPLDQGHCGSLQHRRDAESGLFYMRARYYEPWTGRFLSEDPAMDGANWYVYCANDPLNKVDPSGKSAELIQFLTGVVFFLVGAMVFGVEVPEIERKIRNIEWQIRKSSGADKIKADWATDLWKKKYFDHVQQLGNKASKLRAGRSAAVYIGYAMMIAGILMVMELGIDYSCPIEIFFGSSGE
jgi:RHS repeat-associated protein